MTANMKTAKVGETVSFTITVINSGSRDGRLRTNIGTVASLDDAVATFNSTARRQGKTIIRVRP